MQISRGMPINICFLNSTEVPWFGVKFFTHQSRLGENKFCLLWCLFVDVSGAFFSCVKSDLKIASLWRTPQWSCYQIKHFQFLVSFLRDDCRFLSGTVCRQVKICTHNDLSRKLPLNCARREFRDSIVIKLMWIEHDSAASIENRFRSVLSLFKGRVFKRFRSLSIIIIHRFLIPFPH